MDAVGLWCRHDGLIQRLEASIGPTEECSCPQRQRATHALPVGVGTVLYPTARAGGQTGNPRAIGAALRSGSWWKDEPSLFPAVPAHAPSGQSRPVAGLAHRAFGPAGTGRALLAAMRASAGPPRRAGRADRPSGSDELARATPPTDSTGGKVPLEARYTQLTLFVVGPPGDGLHPVAPRAATFGARSTHRTQGLALFPSSVDGFDDSTAPAGRRQLTAPAPLAHAPLVGGDEIEAGPCAPGAGRFGND